MNRCRRRRAPREQGDTLIEMMIAIIIVAFGVLGIYSALTNSITAGDAVERRADTSQLISQIASQIQLAPWECADPPTDSYRAVLEALKPRPTWTIELRSVSHWSTSRSFEDGCPEKDADPQFQTLKLSIAVRSPGATAEQLTELVKRP